MMLGELNHLRRDCRQKNTWSTNDSWWAWRKACRDEWRRICVYSFPDV